ncbi:MAG: class I SAM-dependent methyltransferase [Acidobacteriota bacterium]|nr:class I SAM-dependent methyltransferase [Acidobacteriota bacterium]
MSASGAPAAGLSPEERAERAASFGQAAAHYERYRPGPPEAAVAWLIPRRVGTVVDVGAGTGALTRLLAARAERVVAVEPDERMRAVLGSVVPGVEVVEGRGEALPLPAGVADALTASASWHWVDPVGGLREAARVLKPGGIVGALWSGPDPDSAFMAQARDLLTGSAADTLPGPAGTLRGAAARAPADQVLRIPEGLPFSEPENEVFRWDMGLTADDLVGLLGTMSWVILMDEGARASLFATVRRLLGEVLGVEGAVTVEVPFRCDTYRSRLLG